VRKLLTCVALTNGIRAFRIRLVRSPWSFVLGAHPTPFRRLWNLSLCSRRLSHWPSVVDLGPLDATAHAGKWLWPQQVCWILHRAREIQRICGDLCRGGNFILRIRLPFSQLTTTRTAHVTWQAKLQPLHYKIIKNWTHRTAEQTNKRLANDTRHGMEWNAMRSAGRRHSRYKYTWRNGLKSRDRSILAGEN